MAVQYLEIARLVLKATSTVTIPGIASGVVSAASVIPLTHKVLDSTGLITSPGGVVSNNTGIAMPTSSFQVKRGSYLAYIQWPFDANTATDGYFEIEDTSTQIPVAASPLIGITNVVADGLDGGHLFMNMYLPETRTLRLTLRPTINAVWPVVADPMGDGNILISLTLYRLD